MSGQDSDGATSVLLGYPSIQGARAQRQAAKGGGKRQPASQPASQPGVSGPIAGSTERAGRAGGN